MIDACIVVLLIFLAGVIGFLFGGIMQAIGTVNKTRRVYSRKRH